MNTPEAIFRGYECVNFLIHFLIYIGLKQIWYFFGNELQQNNMKIKEENER